MDEKENEKKLNSLKKNIKVFWETFIFLVLAFLFAFTMLFENNGYDYSEGMGGIVYLFVFLILFISLFFLIVNVSCSIICFKNRNDCSNSNYILFLAFFDGFYLYCAFIFNFCLCLNNDFMLSVF